ncbi:PDZ domain-containing protein [Paenibacillus artemisiicola]|uniref:PDZ domain-containing protein n=1 Tax=Paenibacillus artemisiicola TaxID=1172618 RepID=UPI0030B8F663
MKNLDAVMDVLRMMGSAALGLLLSPFYYIGVILIMLQYFRQTRLERKLFHVRLHAWPNQLARTMLAGLAVGVPLSLAGLFLGVAVDGEAVLWLWGTAIVLLLVRVRYLCFAYSAGMLGLAQWGLGFTAFDGRSDWIGEAVRSIAGLDIPGLLVLVALMHLAEGLLIRWQGARFASPLFLEGKRGKLIGGYMLQGYWPVPMLLLVPAAAGSGDAVHLPWSLLLGGGGTWSHGVTMIGFPMMIGFSELTRTMLPGAKTRSSSKALLVYGVIVGAAAIAAYYWPPLLLVAVLCALLLHEALVAVSYYKEDSNAPLFVHDDRGLRILAVIPGTPAEAMGLQAGEIIQKANGVRVQTKEELHAALYLNSAFCKLEAINLEGHVKFVQRARYAGEHHQLGVVLAPDDQAAFYAAASPASLFDLLRKRTARSRNRSTTASM